MASGQPASREATGHELEVALEERHHAPGDAVEDRARVRTARHVDFTKLVFSPDGRLLATNGDGNSFDLWDLSAR